MQGIQLYCKVVELNTFFALERDTFNVLLHFSAHIASIHIPAAVYTEEVPYATRGFLHIFCDLVLSYSFYVDRQNTLSITSNNKVQTLGFGIPGENVVASGVSLCPVLKRILMNVQITTPLTCLRYSWTIEHDTMFCMEAT